MIFDRIEWDDDNLDHATRRASVEEIEQALTNASEQWGAGVIGVLRSARSPTADEGL